MLRFIKYVICLMVIIGGSVWAICDTLLAATEATRLREVATETTVTNDWNKAIQLYEAGEQLDEYGKYLVGMTITNMYLVCAFSNTVNWGYSHTCPTCTVSHVRDWPKSNDVFMAIQQRINTTVYHGTNELVKTVRYSKPLKKVIETTIETLSIATNVTTVLKGVSVVTDVITSNKVTYIEDK